MAYEIEVFFDGACPLCAKEIRWIKWLDRKGHKVRFTDIAAPSFRPEEHDRTMEDLMERLYGRLPSGEWIDGVEVFRRLYHAVGFERLVAISRFGPIDALLASVYRVFAKNRLRLTGRCANGACGVPSPR